jgi:hypothetical protein
MYVLTSRVFLQTRTITNISDYTILENASFTNSEIDNGTTILDDTESEFTASFLTTLF